eukprot:49281_1
MLHVKSINTMGDILLQLEQRNYCHVFHATLCNIAFPIGRKYKPFCCTHCLFQIHSILRPNNRLMVMLLKAVDRLILLQSDNDNQGMKSMNRSTIAICLAILLSAMFYL